MYVYIHRKIIHIFIRLTLKTNTMKKIITSCFLVFAAIAVCAQSSETEDKKEWDKLQKYSEERAKFLTEQLSPYDVKNRDIALSPKQPCCRDVSKYEVIDSGFVRIQYALNATDIKNPQTYDDLQKLEIGKRYTKYYSAYVFESDSIATAFNILYNRINHTNFVLEGGNISVVGELRGKLQGWSRYVFSDFFKDMSNNNLTEYCRMPDHIEKYNSFYTETIPVQNWQLCEENQEIAGYQCQKATCHFRGRDYTAWFTVEIPISQGPWKFCGLPGLILKVYDDKQEYVYECVGVEQITDGYPIIRLDNFKVYQNTTREKLDKLVKKITENYYQISGLTNTISKKLRPYNPMELE